jgi:hypothetical protein
MVSEWILIKYSKGQELNHLNFIIISIAILQQPHPCMRLNLDNSDQTMLNDMAEDGSNFRQNYQDAAKSVAPI